MPRLAFSIFICLTLFRMQGLTVRSVMSDDWTNPNNWSTGQVPSNPDTIIIQHYVTFLSNLTIQAPTVLVIDPSATLCGDYTLTINCGAKFYNHGNLYINTSIIHGQVWNDGKYWVKNFMQISGPCTPNPSYNHSGPNAYTYVWPPVLCRTEDTGWQSVFEHEKENVVGLFPNPAHNYLNLIFTSEIFEKVNLRDISGRKIKEFKNLSSEISLDISDLEGGIYFLEFSNEGRSFSKKFLKTN